MPAKNTKCCCGGGSSSPSSSPSPSPEDLNCTGCVDEIASDTWSVGAISGVTGTVSNPEFEACCGSLNGSWDCEYLENVSGSCFWLATISVDCLPATSRTSGVLIQITPTTFNAFFGTYATGGNPRTSFAYFAHYRKTGGPFDCLTAHTLDLFDFSAACEDWNATVTATPA